MTYRMMAGTALALLLAACAPGAEGDQAQLAPLPTPPAEAEEHAPEADDHDDDGGHLEGVGPWTVEDDGYAFTLSLEPTPPLAGTLALTIAVTDPAGNPVAGIEMGYVAFDEDAGRAEIEGEMETTAPGVYSATMELGASAWKFTFHGDIGGADRHAIFEFELT